MVITSTSCFREAFFTGAFFTGAFFTGDFFTGDFLMGDLDAGTLFAGAGTGAARVGLLGSDTTRLPNPTLLAISASWRLFSSINSKLRANSFTDATRRILPAGRTGFVARWGDT